MYGGNILVLMQLSPPCRMGYWSLMKGKESTSLRTGMEAMGEEKR
jgi:hypothetical protein